MLQKGATLHDSSWEKHCRRAAKTRGLCTGEEGTENSPLQSSWLARSRRSSDLVRFVDIIVRIALVQGTYGGSTRHQNSIVRDERRRYSSAAPLVYRRLSIGGSRNEER